MRIIYSFLFFFIGFQSYSQNQTYWSLSIPKEYQDKVVTIVAEEGDLYFFQDKVLVNKIEKGRSKKVLITSKKPVLYSTKSFLVNNVLFLDNENLVLKFEPRNMPLSKIDDYSSIVSVWVLFIFIFIVFLKMANIDVFYGFLMPWMAYSNTEELVAKMNARKIVLPIFLFLLSVFGNIWLIFITSSMESILQNSFLVFFLLIFKIFVLIILEFLLESRGFAKAYLIEFLKMSILFSMLIFFIRLVDMLNPFDFSFIYKILLLLYLFAWLMRILLIFYKDRQQKFMHFFSYLCVSEAIPILILVAFWKS